jgi:putative Mg2+ transporter-C (MgtC) family protein
LPELSAAELTLRLLIAAGLGAAIGLERELREHEAGLRTHLLVAVGAALFTIVTIVSAYAWHDFRFSNASGVGFDPTRIAAQIVTGVGFLGAGAIIRQGLSVRGLTTAATLWSVAAIGMAAGAGFYSAAAIATALVLLSLEPLRRLYVLLAARLRPGEDRLVVDLRPGGALAAVLEALESVESHVSAFAVEEDGSRRSVELRLRLAADGREAAARELSRIEEVAGIHWSS